MTFCWNLWNNYCRCTNTLQHADTNAQEVYIIHVLEETEICICLYIEILIPGRNG